MVSAFSSKGILTLIAFGCYLTMMIGIGLSIVRRQEKLLLPGIFALLAMAATYHAIYNALVQTDLKYWGFVLPLITYIALAPLTFKGRIRKKSGDASPV